MKKMANKVWQSMMRKKVDIGVQFVPGKGTPEATLIVRHFQETFLGNK